MLYLTRKPGEDILIGDNIVVRFAEGRTGRARIGIDAPRDMKILRRELLSRAPEAGDGALEPIKDSIEV